MAQKQRNGTYLQNLFAASHVHDTGTYVPEASEFILYCA